jgi:beta-lactam-binding protein with PASTA domain
MSEAVQTRILQVLGFVWRKRLLRYPVLMVMTIASSFLLLLLVDRVILPFVVHWGEVGVIPDLTDLSLEDAESILDDKGLKLQVSAEVYDLTKPPGTILSQVPQPNSRVREGRFVRVTVSKGGKTVLVPKLQGISIRQAELLLAHQGLEMGDVSWIPSDSFPEDVVIASTPSFETPVPFGMSINLRVSLGSQPDTVEVPNLLGMNIQESRKVLREIGLQLGRIDLKVNQDFLPETILGQFPPPGVKVERGTEMKLEVSTTE